MFNALASIINLLANLLVLIVFVDAILSYFISPYNPARMVLDRILHPLLSPIRRIVPVIGMFDFSPLILIILVEIVSSLLVNFLHSL